MNKTIRRLLTIAVIVLFLLLSIAAFTIFFDEAVLVRKGTIYGIKSRQKLVALTFDDGPSPIWTPQILDALRQAGIKATFFMLGEHVKKYPEVARRVVAEGHEIGNHSYSHHVLLYYKTEELEKEIMDTENIIRQVTGVSPKYFRPPKAWLTTAEKKKIKDMGYRVVLWSLNSKDWVNFDSRHILRYISRNIQPGDILLFHDSGGVFTAEGGSRKETVETIPLLADRLRKMGYRFVTISELINGGEDN
ncbi:MAG: polysaccharide deacetylase family protein [Candidatus Omnitrophica bacterium]|nr:polysaccharide deacetylase family protein [Candidatus Omnitrophota bacterium]